MTILEWRKYKINDPWFYFKKLEKEKLIKPQVNGRKCLMCVEIDKIDNGQAIKKIHEIKKVASLKS